MAGIKAEVYDGGEVTPSQAVALVGVPTFPNCVKFSETNLLAVAAGHLVTILNAASLSGPRGFIPVAMSPLLDIGTVPQEGLRAGSLLPSLLSRDPRPGVRTLDWSPAGLAQNGGCLLAVCTTDNRVKIYREPYADFQSDWVEIMDFSEMALKYSLENNFQDCELVSLQIAMQDESARAPSTWGVPSKRKRVEDHAAVEEPQHRKMQRRSINVLNKDGENHLTVASRRSQTPLSDHSPHAVSNRGIPEQTLAVADAPVGVTTAISKGSFLEVLEENADVSHRVSRTVLENSDGEALVELDNTHSGCAKLRLPIQSPCVNEPLTKKTCSIISSEKVNFSQDLQLSQSRTCLFIAVEGEDCTPSLPREGDIVEMWTDDRWKEGQVLRSDSSGLRVGFLGSNKKPSSQSKRFKLGPGWNGKDSVWKATEAGDFVVSTDQEICTALEVVSEDTNPHMNITPLNTLEPGQTVVTEELQGEDQASLPEDSDATVDNGTGENIAFGLASYKDKTKGSVTKVYARRRPAGDAKLDIPSSCSPFDTPSAGMHTEENSLLRPAMTKKGPTKFKDKDLSIFAETIPDSAPDNRLQLESKQIGQARQVTFAKKMNVVRCLDAEEEIRAVEAVEGVENMTALSNSGEAESDRPNQLRNAIKKARRLKSKLDDKISAAAGYVARIELLSPLVLAWSPKCQGAQMVGEIRELSNFCLLGSGTKSGKVGIWSINYPPCYSIDHVHMPVKANFLGYLDAHNSWVTSLSWTSCNFDLARVKKLASINSVERSGETLLLATGCADGSVKIWAAHTDTLISSPSPQPPPFSFSKIVGKADCVPVTSLALVSSQPSEKALLAVGKGSGSLTIYEITSSGFCHKLYHGDGAHQQTVTGLSWRFDGSCLYSCGQDSLRIWELSKEQLRPLIFPDWSAVFPTITSPDLCTSEAMESFFGVAVSHHCLALATVRGLASDLLDQMYQSRSQKGILQMFWLGSRPNHVKANVELCHVPRGILTGQEISSWQFNIISALQHLENPRETLVLWDVIAALSLLRQALGGEVVVALVAKWLFGWTRGEDTVGVLESTETTGRNFENAVSEASCRQLHILNIICRRLLLSHFKAEALNAYPAKKGPHTQTIDTVTRQEKLWRECMYLVEHELRQRLVYLRLSKTISEEEVSDCVQGGDFSSAVLNAKWVLDNPTSMFPELTKLATQFRKSHRNPYRSLSATCPLCESTVLLESPEGATCQGSEMDIGADKHQLQRCSVSMQVCPPVCMWHCSCCERWAIKQPFASFFALSSRWEIGEESSYFSGQKDTYPNCPFCGILMHRLLPNFLLTPSLV